MDWMTARTQSDTPTLDDAVHAWRNRDMPSAITSELNRSKLQRLEHGGSAKLSAIAKAHLADMYGVLLSDIDPAAAADYIELMQAVRIATWKTANPGVAA